ncbi:MAG TPA: sulfotransferase family protein, partial [Sphingobium sp.]|nr:sulfotransferase family protein [Sphingobium sp.]
MIHALRETGKRTAGWLLSRSAPGLDYRNCLFVLAHMRCGSTALSNILCSRPDVSGYGESHVRHDGQGALGRLAMNQMRRGGWKPQAPILFDKILHSRHDWATPHEFFDA